MSDRLPTEPAPGRREVLRAIGARAVRVRSDLFFACQDIALVAASFGCILLVRFGGQVPDDAWRGYLRFLPVAIVVYVLSHWVAGLYGQVWRYASVLEARRLLLAGGSSLLVLGLLDVLGLDLVPGSVLLAGGLFTTMLVGMVRFGSRLFSSRRRDETATASGLRVVVLGAGVTGAALVREMRDNDRSGLVPVALLDDDPRLQGRTVLGVRVAGRLSDLSRVCAEVRAHQVVLAIPSAPRDLVRRLAGVAHDNDVVLRVLPSAYDPVVGSLRLRDMRDLEIEDLLGRTEIQTDLGAVRSLLEGRRVLVTGAGGSIGSEIAAQVAGLDPSMLLLLDHDETHLYDVEQSLENRYGAAVAGMTRSLLADIRDRELMLRLFERHRPEVVFHAAAHKHVPLLEDHPAEALLTNVLGTAHLLAASRETGVRNFVFISTDKAVVPSSVMGASKHLAERFVLASDEQSGGAYSAVRFGNVLGSRGSVIPTFVRQIQAGGPVTVTDPRMTRFFMSTREAVQLVLQAASMARGGEVFMLEMGEPVEILDLAKRMIRMSGQRVGEDIELRVVGTRPGEKLEEQLWLPDEGPESTQHPSVVRLRPRRLTPAQLAQVARSLRRLVSANAEDQIKADLFALAQDADGWVSRHDQRGTVVDLRQPVDVERRLG